MWYYSTYDLLRPKTSFLFPVEQTERLQKSLWLEQFIEYNKNWVTLSNYIQIAHKVVSLFSRL